MSSDGKPIDLDQPELPFDIFDEFAPDPSDQDEGERRRDEAMERAEVGAGEGWIEHAMECVHMIALGSEEFTTDDVWAVLGTDTITELRAMGPVMKKAAAEGWITKAGYWKNSKRPDCHARPLAVWRSLIYGADQMRGRGF